MNEKQSAILALESLLRSCEDNGKQPDDDNDAFMRGSTSCCANVE